MGFSPLARFPRYFRVILPWPGREQRYFRLILFRVIFARHHFWLHGQGKTLYSSINPRARTAATTSRGAPETLGHFSSERTGNMLPWGPSPHK